MSPINQWVAVSYTVMEMQTETENRPLTGERVDVLSLFPYLNPGVKYMRCESYYGDSVTCLGQGFIIFQAIVLLSRWRSHGKWVKIMSCKSKGMIRPGGLVRTKKARPYSADDHHVLSDTKSSGTKSNIIFSYLQ